MNTIFDLQAAVLADYRDFVRSFFLIDDERARAFVERALEEGAHLWPEALVQLSPAYAPGLTVDEMAREGVISEETARIFYHADGKPFRLYLHQEEAIRKVLAGESIIVTSGTGSGKSLCYFLPILESLIERPDTGGRVAAVVVYPMNALVNSQLQALRGLKERYERSLGRPFPVTFAKYTGETSDAEREEMRRNPPQILLTNYVMAELLLVRPEDQRFLDRTGGGLRFLVFDELHTYRGRQGADVAMLVRRLKERCAGRDLVHIGTSATMIARPDASAAERRQSVADFATRFFGHPFGPEQVIEETLEPFTEGGLPAAEELRSALSVPPPPDVATLQRHPLMRWMEYELGIEQEAEGSPRRRIPRPLSELARQLSEITGFDPEHCAGRLRDLLVCGGGLQNEDGNRAVAFKLHQFVAQGRTLYATLEASDQRQFSLEGQVQAGEGNMR